MMIDYQEESGFFDFLPLILLVVLIISLFSCKAEMRIDSRNTQEIPSQFKDSAGALYERLASKIILFKYSDGTDMSRENKMDMIDQVKEHVFSIYAITNVHDTIPLRVNAGDTTTIIVEENIE